MMTAIWLYKRTNKQANFRYTDIQIMLIVGHLGVGPRLSTQATTLH